MRNTQDRIELLINRKLDGALTPDEDLELQRAIVRSPEARRMMELSEQIDAICPDVLSEHLKSDGRLDVSQVTSVPLRAPQSIPSRAWWMVPIAMAACMAIFFLPDATTPPLGNGNQGFVNLPPTAGPIPVVGNDQAQQYQSTGNGVTPVSTRRPFIDGRRDTDVYSVIGADGNVYLIEVERVRTIERPAQPRLARSPHGEL